MNEKQALDFIASYRYLGSKPGLSRMTCLCALLCNPQKRLKFVHIAGTNGKGSTAVMLACILKRAGYKTGLFTSPYLESMRESIRTNGRKISQSAFATACDEIKNAVQQMEKMADPPTEYEILTALAFVAFEKAGCDIVVLEACMGGRQDTTNVIDTPLISVITAISFDHMKMLGTHIEKIAEEKSGIIKKDGVVVIYPLQEKEVMGVLHDKATREGCRSIYPDISKLFICKERISGSTFWYDGHQLQIRLSGRHQVYNAMTAVVAANVLRHSFGYAISDQVLAEGLFRARHPGRQEVLCQSPLVLLDGAHNPHGAHALANFLATHVRRRPLVMIVGIFADKEYAKILAHLAPACDMLIAVTPEHARALPAALLFNEAKNLGMKALMAKSMQEAVTTAFSISQKTGAVVICGSLSLVPSAKRAVKAICKKGK